MPDNTEPRVVEAVAFSGGCSDTSLSGGKKPRAQFMEQQVTAAIAAAQAEGVTDPDAIKVVIAETRGKVREFFKRADTGNLER